MLRYSVVSDQARSRVNISTLGKLGLCDVLEVPTNEWECSRWRRSGRRRRFKWKRGSRWSGALQPTVPGELGVSRSSCTRQQFSSFPSSNRNFYSHLVRGIRSDRLTHIRNRALANGCIELASDRPSDWLKVRRRPTASVAGDRCADQRGTGAHRPEAAVNRI